jgi:hypothetical protein
VVCSEYDDGVVSDPEVVYFIKYFDKLIIDIPKTIEVVVIQPL